LRPKHGGMTVYGDPKLLERVVDNLVGNAIKFTPDGGQIGLALRHAGNEAILQVTDTGIGMSPEVLAHVLEPFYTTKNDGSGLGLTIAAQIVRDHGGELKIDSREGESTTVTMRLPAA